MQLSIISIEKSQELAIDWIEVTTNQGGYVIQSQHAPMVLSLLPESKVIYKLTAQEEPVELPIKQALLHVTRKECTLLLTRI